MNVYERLFNAMDACKEYDEEKFITENRREPFIANLSWQKNYLYGLILKSLRQTPTFESVSMELSNRINEIEILCGRMMYKQALDILLDARALAQKHEKFLYLLILQGWEWDIYRYTQDTEALDKYCMNDRETMDNIFRQHRIIYQYRRKLGQIENTKLKTETFLSRQTKDSIGELLDDPVIHDPLPETVHGRLYFHLVDSVRFRMAGDREKWYSSLVKSFGLLKENPHLQETEGNLLFVTLSRLLYCCLHLRKFDEYLIYYTYLEEHTLPGRKTFYSPEMKARVSGNLFRSKMIYCCETGDYAGAMRFIEENMEKIGKIGPDLSKEFNILIYANIIEVYFCNENFRKSLRWINKFINDFPGKMREDVLATLQIFRLIIHYELGNYDLLEYLIPSTYRFLLKKREMNGFEKALVRFFRENLQVISHPSQVTAAFRNLWNEWRRYLVQHPDEIEFLETSSYIAWLDAKVSGKPFKTILQEKASLSGRNPGQETLRHTGEQNS